MNAQYETITENYAPAAQSGFTPTPEQRLAIDAIVEFVSAPTTESWYFCFVGYAGTGKTSCMREVVARFSSSRTKFAYTAPTNKAAKVLKAMTGEASTIYSLLGLRVDKDGETKRVVGGKTIDLSDLDVIVVDEASMVNAHLFGILNDVAAKWGLRVVFMGDLAQLPPVGESASYALTGGDGARLSRVMRHDNQILSLATRIREVIEHPAPSIQIRSDNDGQQGVWKMTKFEFKKSIFDAAQHGEFADGAKSKVISWRNKLVNEYNNIIRAAIFGAEAVPGYFLPGDRIVAGAPCERGDELLMTTDEEAIVESIAVTVHPFEPKYKAIELKCVTESNRIARLLVIHPESLEESNRDAEGLAHEARGNSRSWKRFWEHKELFHDVRYAYAITAHRSQGSTYEQVWVDASDILFNRNRKEAFQCLYVASTRPTTKLMLALG